MEIPTKPEWGLGRVVQDPAMGKVCIHFKEVGEKVLSLKHARIAHVEGEAARDSWLDNMDFDASSQGLPYVGPRAAVASFLERFPGGFRGPRFLEEIRENRMGAHELLLELLGREQAQELIAAESWVEIGKRALKVMTRTGLVYPVEKSAFNRALKDPEQAAHITRALVDQLYGEDAPDVRFKRFCDALGQINAARWTLATYFPFIRYPAEHMLLKPTFTQQAAALCRFDLNYRAEPNRATYGRLLAFARVLKEVLADLQPADMFDVQGFIWSLSQDKD